MSKDLKRAVETERKALKAKDRKMAELRQPHDDIPEASIADPVSAEKKKLKSKQAARAAFRKD